MIGMIFFFVARQSVILGSFLSEKRHVLSLSCLDIYWLHTDATAPSSRTWSSLALRSDLWILTPLEKPRWTISPLPKKTFFSLPGRDLDDAWEEYCLIHIDHPRAAFIRNPYQLCPISRFPNLLLFLLTECPHLSAPPFSKFGSSGVYSKLLERRGAQMAVVWALHYCVGIIALDIRLDVGNIEFHHLSEKLTNFVLCHLIFTWKLEHRRQCPTVACSIYFKIFDGDVYLVVELASSSPHMMSPGISGDVKCLLLLFFLFFFKKKNHCFVVVVIVFGLLQQTCATTIKSVENGTDTLVLKHTSTHATNILRVGRIANSPVVHLDLGAFGLSFPDWLH